MLRVVSTLVRSALSGNGTLRVAVATVALTVVMALTILGAGCDSHDDRLPAWLPDELAGLTIELGNPADFDVARSDAIMIARKELFLGGGPSELPEALPTLISGKVNGTRATFVPSSGKVGFRQVDDRPAWLLVWRRVLRSELDTSGTASANEVIVDFTTFVDAETGDVLASIVLAGPARLG